MKIKIPTISLLSLFIIIVATNLISQNPVGKSSFKYFIDSDNDGTYDSIKLDKKTEPQPIQGMVQFERDIIRNIKYPAIARNKSISGQVLLSLYVDQTGKVTDIKVKKSPHESLAESSIQAVSIVSKEGFWPFIYENKPTPFIMDMTLKYNLE